MVARKAFLAACTSLALAVAIGGCAHMGEPAKPAEAMKSAQAVEIMKRQQEGWSYVRP